MKRVEAIDTILSVLTDDEIVLFTFIFGGAWHSLKYA